MTIKVIIDNIFFNFLGVVLMEIKLSKYADDCENKWFLDCKKNADIFIAKLNEITGKNYYEEYNFSDSVKLFYHIDLYTLFNTPSLMYECLNKSGLSIEKYELAIICSFVNSIIRERDYYDAIAFKLKEIGIINSYGVDKDNNWMIDTKKYGKFHFKKLSDCAEFLNFSEDLKERKYNTFCHKISRILMEKNSNYNAVTSICEKDLEKKYFHSFVIDENDIVIDFTDNICMPKEDYYLLHGVQELSVVNINDFNLLDEETSQFDESGTLYSLLRIACYKRIKDNQKNIKLF